MIRIARYSITMVAILCMGLLLYWAKCQFRIDLFRSVKWEHYLPLDKLQRQEKIVSASQDGHLIQDGFEASSLIEWAPLWSRSGQGRAVIQDETGGGHSVRIDHASLQDWSFQRDEMVAVEPGQALVFGFRYRANSPSEASVILYDGDKQVTDWHFGALALPVAEEWQSREQSIVIPDGGRYIRLRVTGSGDSRVSLDDIFMKRDR